MKNNHSPIYAELMYVLFILLCSLFVIITVFFKILIEILEMCIHIYNFLYDTIPVIRARIIMLKNSLRYIINRIFS